VTHGQRPGRAAEILKEHPGHPVATLLLGTARRSFGDPGAEAAFVELAAVQPDSALAQFELGRTLVSQGRKCRCADGAHPER